MKDGRNLYNMSCFLPYSLYPGKKMLIYFSYATNNDDVKWAEQIQQMV
jgi:hypothetical protein